MFLINSECSLFNVKYVNFSFQFLFRPVVMVVFCISTVCTQVAQPLGKLAESICGWGNGAQAQLAVTTTVQSHHPQVAQQELEVAHPLPGLPMPVAQQELEVPLEVPHPLPGLSVASSADAEVQTVELANPGLSELDQSVVMEAEAQSDTLIELHVVEQLELLEHDAGHSEGREPEQMLQSVQLPLNPVQDAEHIEGHFEAMIEHASHIEDLDSLTFESSEVRDLADLQAAFKPPPLLPPAPIRPHLPPPPKYGAGTTVHHWLDDVGGDSRDTLSDTPEVLNDSDVSQTLYTVSESDSDMLLHDEFDDSDNVDMLVPKAAVFKAPPGGSMLVPKAPPGPGGSMQVPKAPPGGSVLVPKAPPACPRPNWALYGPPARRSAAELCSASASSGPSHEELDWAVREPWPQPPEGPPPDSPEGPPPLPQPPQPQRMVRRWATNRMWAAGPAAPSEGF